MKILVLGSSGMAGHLIMRYLMEQKHDVTGFARRKENFEHVILGDARNQALLHEILQEGDYDAVINCIGILNQFVDQDIQQGIYINALFPHLLVEELKHMRTKLIHMSTDCVFLGNTGPYTEKSICDGNSYYDRTKALGEINDAKNLTFRMSIVGPDQNEDGIGLFHWFMKQKECKGYRKVIWTGVTTLTLAKAIEAAIREDLCGLYHLVNTDAINKYELCQLFNHYFRGDSVKIQPYDGIVLDKTLVNTRNDFSFKVPSYEMMIFEMSQWVKAHPEDYRYNIGEG